MSSSGSQLGFTVQTFPDCVNPIADQLESRMRIKPASDDGEGRIVKTSVALESYSIDSEGGSEESSGKGDDVIESESEARSASSSSEKPDSNPEIKEVSYLQITV